MGNQLFQIYCTPGWKRRTSKCFSPEACLNMQKSDRNRSNSVHHLCSRYTSLREDSETHTCDLVSMLFTHTPVLQFQKRMCLSAVPPPLASRLGCQGHHARAWSRNDNTGSDRDTGRVSHQNAMYIVIVSREITFVFYAQSINEN